MQDHPHNNGVPTEPLLDLHWLLLLQRADVHPAGPAHLLGGAHRAHGHQVPARQRRGRWFYFSFCLPPPQPTRALGSFCRTSWRMRGATGKRRSRTRTRALTAKRRKNPQTVTCVTDTLPSTTTTVKETEWTVRVWLEAFGGETVGLMQWAPRLESQRKWSWWRGSSMFKQTQTFN